MNHYCATKVKFFFKFFAVIAKQSTANYPEMLLKRAVISDLQTRDVLNFLSEPLYTVKKLLFACLLFAAADCFYHVATLEPASLKAALSKIGFRPGYRNLLFFFGISGSMSFHNWSCNIGFAMSNLLVTGFWLLMLLAICVNILSFC